MIANNFAEDLERKVFGEEVPQGPSSHARRTVTNATIHDDGRCLISPKQLRDSEGFDARVPSRPARILEGDLRTDLGRDHDTPPVRHSSRCVTVPAVLDNECGKVEAPAVRRNLAWQAREVVGGRFDLETTQRAAHQPHIDAGFAEADAELRPDPGVGAVSVLQLQALDERVPDVPVAHARQSRPSRTGGVGSDGSWRA